MKLRTFITLGAGTFALLPMSAYAQQTQPYYPGAHMMWGGGYGWFFGPLMMLAFLGIAALIIALIVRWAWGLGRTSGDAGESSQNQTPLDILKARFAKGEIDKKEYDDRKKTLME